MKSDSSEIITVIGAGYVGSAIAALFGQKFKTNLIDIDKAKVKKINKRISPINDSLLQNYLSKEKTTIHAYSKLHNDLILETSLFIICLPIIAVRR